jgi:hypothetical protein
LPIFLLVNQEFNSYDLSEFRWDGRAARETDAMIAR